MHSNGITGLLVPADNMTIVLGASILSLQNNEYCGNYFVVLNTATSG